MATPVAGVLILAFMATATATISDSAQECRVYQLMGKTDHFSTPLMPVQNLSTVSFYNQNVGDLPNNVLIILGGTAGQATLHINKEGQVLFSNENVTLGRRTFNITPAHVAHTWLSLAILIQDQNILIYRTDQRESFLSANTTLGSNVTAKVTTSQAQLYVTMNCPAGCLMHDSTSFLINRSMPLVDGVNIYVIHEEGAKDADMSLAFRDHKNKEHSVTIHATTFEASRWHKIAIYHNGENKVIVKAKKGAEVHMSKGDITFAIKKATSMLWSLHCYPDHATGIEDWIMPKDMSNGTRIDDQDSGAGVAEVLAWVLAGIALFLVFVMAFMLCTRMAPRSASLDYGASIGMVTSFGRGRDREVPSQDVVREAEEDTEPDSPTFMAPIIHHKVPEEEDEQQSNTKML